MPKMYDGAKIVSIEYADDGKTYRLYVETDCPFHLSQVITIPDDPTIFDDVDIPAYDSRNVADWLRSL